jgi:protease IV
MGVQMKNKGEKMAKETGNRWLVAFFVVVFIGFISLFAAGIIGILSGAGDGGGSGNIALIPIEGVITTEREEGLFGEGIASSDKINSMIERAVENDAIEGIIFEINSPGGTPVATDEIAQRIKEIEKPNVAYIREIGTSGAYWIASASDHVIANRMSITGSIGVIGSYLDFSQLLDEYNVSYQRLVSGKYKDMGSPFKNLSQEERIILQESIDLIAKEFIDEVAMNRNMSIEKARSLATGQYFIGSQAKELGLIDETGGLDEAISYIESQTGQEGEIIRYSQARGFLAMMMQAMGKQSFNVGRGIGYSFANQGTDGIRV